MKSNSALQPLISALLMIALAIIMGIICSDITASILFVMFAAAAFAEAADRVRPRLRARQRRIKAQRPKKALHKSA